MFFILIGGVDYVPISVSQNITGGSTECITIDIINDATPENEEHFFVVLNVSVQVGQNITLARVNILDNDSCKDYKKIPQHLYVSLVSLKVLMYYLCSNLQSIMCEWRVPISWNLSVRQRV